MEEREGGEKGGTLFKCVVWCVCVVCDSVSNYTDLRYATLRPLLRLLLLLTKSANLEVAARRAVWGTFTNAGQTCIRPDYMMVHESVADELVAEMKKASVRQRVLRPSHKW